MKKILKYEIYLEVDMPTYHEALQQELFTDDESVEFFFNESSHCKDNILDGIKMAKTAYDESAEAVRNMTTYCTCFCSEVSVVEEKDLPHGVTPMKIEHY